VLLNDNDIAGAKNVLLYFSYGPDNEITMDEMGEVTDYITMKTGSQDTNVIWGTGFDDSLGGKVKITLIATGFETKEKKDPEVHVLPPEKPEETKPVGTENITEPTLMSAPKRETEPKTIPLDQFVSKPDVERVSEPTPMSDSTEENPFAKYGRIAVSIPQTGSRHRQQWRWEHSPLPSIFLRHYHSKPPFLPLAISAKEFHALDNYQQPILHYSTFPSFIIFFHLK
jgi:hypothetical protein